MRLAFVSDVHGNLTALEAVLADLRHTAPDLVVHGGDLVLNGSSPAAVVDRVRELGWPGVLGNTDEMLWSADRLLEIMGHDPARADLRRILLSEMTPATREALGADRIAWLQSLPLSWANEDVGLVHASPGDLWRAPLAGSDDEALEATYAAVARRLVVYAHIHHPFVRSLGPFAVANTGSVSLSYDGDPRASYLLIDNGVASTRRVEYDIAREVRALRAGGYPQADWLASLLETGRFRPPPRTT